MQAFSEGSRALAMTAATARMVSVRIPETDRPPRLRLAEPIDSGGLTVDKPAAAKSAAKPTATAKSAAKPTATATSRSARSLGPVSLLARSQLADAHRGLDRSMQSQDISDRYAAAHLGALRGAAALLATRPKPSTRSLKHASVWVLLTKVAPELEDWANYFAAGSAKRKAAEAGISRLISDQDATDMVRQTAEFLELIEQMIQQ